MEENESYREASKYKKCAKEVRQMLELKLERKKCKNKSGIAVMEMKFI